MKAQKFSLIGILAAALLLSAAFVPKANATLIVYYNFEDATVIGGAPDYTSTGDLGTQHPNLIPSTTNNATAQAGLPLNVATGDPDSNNFSLGLTKSKSNDPRDFQFTVSTLGLSQLALSFAQNSNGNGYANVTLSYNGNVNNDAITKPLLTGGNMLVTFNVPSLANNQASVTFTLTFSGGSSNGTDLQTVIDNIQLNAVPEPSTVMGGLLGVFSLCWHQRRRLIRSLRLRRA